MRQSRTAVTGVNSSCTSIASAHDEYHLLTDKRSSTPKPATTESISSNPVRPASLRKSVSFTPDTKSQDGFSAHKLFKAWAAGKDPAEVAAQSKSSALPEQPSPSKTPKKEKRPKKTKGVLGSTDTPAEPDEEAENSPKETPNYIRYLQQYHTDRSGWKFNKNRQNDLFKNIFNLHRIPVEHDAAVIEYISGLQGQARQRVANQAEEVLKAVWMQQNEGTDPMSLETADARRAAYYAALRSAYESYKAAEPSRDQFSDRELRDILRELQKAKRAEDILQRALNGEIFTQQQPRLATRPGPSVLSSSTIPRATRISETTQTGRGTYETTEKDLVNGNETKRKRNRKARTEVSDDSDSSSSQDDSSSSQDDSSSDESDSPARKRPASMGPGNGEKDAAQKPKTSPANTAKADRANVSQAIKGNLFDTALLDKKFGKAKS